MDMINQNVLIGIAVGVFFVGIAAGYGIFLTTYQPSQMMTQNQLMQQMMMQSPEHRQQMMDTLTQNTQDMRQWMANTQHIQEMSDVMKGNHDFMQEMMFAIINEPDLRLQMIGHMTENAETVKIMQQMMGGNRTMMHSGSMINPGMMNP